MYQHVARNFEYDVRNEENLYLSAAGGMLTSRGNISRRSKYEESNVKLVARQVQFLSQPLDPCIANVYPLQRLEEF